MKSRRRPTKRSMPLAGWMISRLARVQGLHAASCQSVVLGELRGLPRGIGSMPAPDTILCGAHGEQRNIAKSAQAAQPPPHFAGSLLADAGSSRVAGSSEKRSRFVAG